MDVTVIGAPDGPTRDLCRFFGQLGLGRAAAFSFSCDSFIVIKKRRNNLLSLSRQHRFHALRLALARRHLDRAQALKHEYRTHAERIVSRQTRTLDQAGDIEFATHGGEESRIRSLPPS
jgi:hypothetical protein